MWVCEMLLQLFISFQYIYIAHLDSDFCRFSNVALEFFLLRPLSILCHSTFLEGSHPLPDELPGEHTGLPSHMRQYLFNVWPFNAALTHTLTLGR